MKTTLLISLVLIFYSTSAQKTKEPDKMKFTAIRLKPHQDLKKELMAYAEKNKIVAGFIATCVGSLEQVNLRYANQPNGTLLKGHFEILSVSGTLSTTSAHLHLSVADSTGKTIGGHLLDSNLIYTTAEIVIGELLDIEFTQALDSAYGYQELVIKAKKR